MHVKSILHDKGRMVATIRPDATISAAIDILKTRRIGALVVSRDEKNIDGILSERDIIAGLSNQGASLLDDLVESIMTCGVRTCTPENTVTEVMELMTDWRIRHVPVVEDGALSGIVSIGDAVKQRLQELESEASHLREYISH
ncbi:MAG: CBS domain-containing protein [Alphaproteobacteria bacterium]